MRGKSQWFHLTINPHKFQASGRNQNGRYQASCYGEKVSVLRWNFINCIIWNIRGQYSNATNKIDKTSIQSVSANKIFLIGIFMEKMKLVVMGHRWGWTWTSKNPNEKMFFGNFGLSRFWCYKRSQWFFTSILLCQFYVLDWVSNGKIRSRSGWEVQVWQLSKLKKVALFKISGPSKLWCKENKSNILPSTKTLHLEIIRCWPW